MNKIMDCVDVTVYTVDDVKIEFKSRIKIHPQDFIDEMRETGFISIDICKNDSFCGIALAAREIKKIIIEGNFK